MIMTILSWK